MSYKHFYGAIMLRLAVIILLSAAATFLFFEIQSLILCVFLLILLAIAVINIIKYFNGLNHWISSFLLGIENNDTTLRIPSKTNNRSINDVYSGIERLNLLFKHITLEISAQEQYFRSVIDQSVTGLFSVDSSGRVININPAAKKLTNLNEYFHVNNLSTIDKDLPDFILKTSKKANQNSAVFENTKGQKLLFKISEIKTQDESIKLIALSDITKELDNREIDSWIKLARTLSHEIMNNIAPITTLSKVITGYFTRDNKTVDAGDIDKKTITNTVKGLRVIEERGLGLISFVENYRKFTKLPEPRYKEVNLSALIESNLVTASAYPGFDDMRIEKNIANNLMFSTDEKLLSQVILNLLKNAYEALAESKDNPRIIVGLSSTDTSIKIDISNNGPQIPSELKEQIFVPFYTTKENGSGIGLSLSKQIVLQMGGDLILSTGTENKLTTFSIILNSELASIHP